MCPSYLASKDEKDVTRGRARVLQELTNGTLIPDWHVPGGARVAGPVPVLQGLCQRLPGRGRHGPVQVGGAAPDATGAERDRSATTASAGCPAGSGSSTRLPRVGPAVINRACPSSRCPGCCSAPAASTRGATHRRSRRPLSTGGTGRTGRPTPTTRAREPGRAVGRLLHRRDEPRGRAGRHHGAAGRRVPGHRPRRSGLLRPDLDHHRPARRRQEAPHPAAGHPRTLCGAGHPDRRAGTVLHRGAALATWSTCSPTIHDPPRSPVRPGPWPSS